MSIRLSYMSTALLAVLLLCAFGKLRAQQDQFSGLNGGDHFGQSVAIDGSLAIIGAPEVDDFWLSVGRAYVYAFDGQVWTKEATLVKPSPSGDEYFGSSVAISGDTAVVGLAPVGGTGVTGRVYVYVRSGTTWTLQQQFGAFDGGVSDNFGGAVDIEGDTIVVGASHANTADGDSGAVYVYSRSGTTWTGEAKLFAADGTWHSYLGRSVALSGDTIVAGAPGQGITQSSGFVYVFRKSGGSWAQEAKFKGSDGASGDEFGEKVSIVNDTALIGAHFDDNAAGTNAGAAYAFLRTGNSWAQQAKLLASNGVGGDEFGKSVALLENTAVVGAMGCDFPGKANAGAAYIFRRVGTVWAEQSQVVPSNGATGDNFGRSAAASGDKVIVGAYNDDNTGGVDAGSAYVYAAEQYLQPWTDVGFHERPLTVKRRSASFAAPTWRREARIEDSFPPCFHPHSGEGWLPWCMLGSVSSGCCHLRFGLAGLRRRGPSRLSQSSGRGGLLCVSIVASRSLRHCLP